MADREAWDAWFVQGLRMSASEIATVEARLQDAPDDVTARLQLMGYYFSSHREQTRCHEQIFWCIKNHPEIHLRADISHVLFPEAYAEGRRLWHEVLERRPDDPVVLKPAADFVRFADDALYRELLQRGQRLAPEDPHWRTEIRDERSGRARYTRSEEERIACGLEALDDYNAELATEKRRTYRLHITIKLAEAALWAANAPLATAYAESLVANAEQIAGTWVHGDVIHWAHIILGRIALRGDDVRCALAHLAAASATPGSQTLTASGPDQDLALELLKRGERGAVIAYIEDCKRFWGGGFGLLGGAYRDNPPPLRVA